MDSDLDLRVICGALRKLLNCTVNVMVSKEGGEVMQLQGDHREACKRWLLEQEIVPKAEADRIVIHGF